jgi:hypothetical protein
VRPRATRRSRSPTSILRPSPTSGSRAAHPSATEAVFENPTHDFPKRIGYRLVSSDSLEAWIDGGAESKGPKISYGSTRVSGPETL